MDRELVLLLVVVVALVMRAVYASAVLHRHVGWVVAASFAAGLIVEELSAPDWMFVACLLSFVVSEAVFQLGGDSDPRPPATWLSPLIRRFPAIQPGVMSAGDPRIAPNPRPPDGPLPYRCGDLDQPRRPLS